MTIGKKKVTKWSELTDHQKAFLKAYLNPDADTYCNATKSAQVAYNAKSYRGQRQIGYETLIRLRPLIDKWWETEGLSEDYVKSCIKDLTKAQKKVFFAKDGIVIDEKVVSDNAVRAKATELAVKVRGMAKRDNELSIGDINITIDNGDEK